LIHASGFVRGETRARCLRRGVGRLDRRTLALPNDASGVADAERARPSCTKHAISDSKDSLGVSEVIGSRSTGRLAAEWGRSWPPSDHPAPIAKFEVSHGTTSPARPHHGWNRLQSAHRAHARPAHSRQASLTRRRYRFVRIRVLDSDELTRRTRPDDHLLSINAACFACSRDAAARAVFGWPGATIEAPPERMSALGARTRKNGCPYDRTRAIRWSRHAARVLTGTTAKTMVRPGRRVAALGLRGSRMLNLERS
jgi:hypothetical protein